MDDEQLRELRRWADGLATVDSPELRAAGKAIVMLADEVEALRARPAVEHSTEAVATPEVMDEGSPGEIGSALRGRLRSFARAHLAQPSGDSAPEQRAPADRLD